MDPSADGLEPISSWSQTGFHEWVDFVGLQWSDCRTHNGAATVLRGPVSPSDGIERQVVPEFPIVAILREVTVAIASTALGAETLTVQVDGTDVERTEAFDAAIRIARKTMASYRERQFGDDLP